MKGTGTVLLRNGIMIDAIFENSDIKKAPQDAWILYPTGEFYIGKFKYYNWEGKGIFFSHDKT